MSADTTSEELKQALVDLEEEQVLTLVQAQLGSRDPFTVFDDLRAGLTRVGDLFEEGEYFLTELILAADIFQEATRLIEPHFPKQAQSRGTVVIGTVKDDFHDIGKNIMISLLRSNGFEVADLGKDVDPETFVAKVKELEPDVLGMSGLLTFAIRPMEETVKRLRAEYTKPIIIMIGGQPVNDDWVKAVGADFGTNNAATAMKLINQAIQNIQT